MRSAGGARRSVREPRMGPSLGPSLGPGGSARGCGGPPGVPLRPIAGCGSRSSTESRTAAVPPAGFGCIFRAGRRCRWERALVLGEKAAIFVEPLYVRLPVVVSGVLKRPALGRSPVSQPAACPARRGSAPMRRLDFRKTEVVRSVKLSVPSLAPESLVAGDIRSPTGSVRWRRANELCVNREAEAPSSVRTDVPSPSKGVRARERIS